MINENFFKYYQEIISLNTVSSESPSLDISNEPFIDYLSEKLSLKGFVCNKIKVNKSHSKYNLIASYQNKNMKHGGLAFSGHTDTVPFDETLWDSNPLVLNKRDGKIYGLGVIDMKGFFAFILYLLDIIDLNLLSKPLYIFATADEETSMNGARELVPYIKNYNNTVETKIEPELIIIGEPTSMTPVIMHKGHLVQKIAVKGIGGHSSDPNSGINAIKIMNKILSKLIELENDLKNNFTQPLLPIPYPTSNIGMIQGGDAPNRICDYCEVQFDIRPIPNLSVDYLEKLTLKYLDSTIKEYPNRISITKPYPAAEPFNANIPSKLKEYLQEICKKNTIAVNYATEATFLQELGPTIVMGPGNIALAHKPNEYLDIKEIQPTLDILKKLLLAICM
ncbi:MAG: acetylornithine deacetylase [Succinivibrionaceae bacterium]